MHKIIDTKNRQTIFSVCFNACNSFAFKSFYSRLYIHRSMNANMIPRSYQYGKSSTKCFFCGLNVFSVNLHEMIILFQLLMRYLDGYLNSIDIARQAEFIGNVFWWAKKLTLFLRNILILHLIRIKWNNRIYFALELPIQSKKTFNQLWS